MSVAGRQRQTRRKWQDEQQEPPQQRMFQAASQIIANVFVLSTLNKDLFSKIRGRQFQSEHFIFGLGDLG